MRISLTLDIERSRPPEPERPEGDVYATTERAAYVDGPQIGFTREEPEWDDRGRRERR